MSVIVDYEDVVKTPTSINYVDLSSKLESAYGYYGYGILAVRGVPGLAEKRAQCLPLAHAFAHLPEDTQAEYVHAQSSYSFGWSHGKEKMSAGTPDFSKGSYYANPTHDVPFTDEAIVQKWCSFAHPNIWPSEDHCAGFRGGFKGLGQLIVDTGALLAAHIDKYVHTQLEGYAAGSLATTISTSRVTKGRLLYYFPVQEGQCGGSEGNGDGMSWCGWHNDHGSLTGLAPAMYVDSAGREVPCPDPAAGLYVKSRQGEVVRVSVPPDCLAFQIGECAQILSGGVLQATPHAVRACSTPGIARCTMAIFMEPEWGCPMAVPPGTDLERVLRGSNGELLPKGVPPLVQRWNPDGSQDFGQFTDATLASYYS